MYLERIALTNFKNIEEATISFSPKINCICGSNGEGKTNLLDAIHYLSLTKSYFATGDSYTYRYGSSETAISGHYITDEGLSERIAIYMKRGGEKQVRRGKKNYTKFSEHIGLIPIVMVSPYDTSLINDSGEERRRFLNTILSQIDREYMHNLQCYNQLLVSRNKLLKEEFLNQELLETISAQMAPYAEYIHTKRLEICALLAKEAERFYAELSNEKESVSLEYSSDMADIGFKEMMAQSIERDRALGYTVSGIQRDNFIFKLNGHRIKHCGSQGQQKTFLISLKMAQFSLMKQIYGFPPILLLDDIFDRLDSSRVDALVKLVCSDIFGQIFITDSDSMRITSVVKQYTPQCSCIIVKNGIYSPIETEGNEAV